MISFVPGQKWISETEPELGLGTVLQAGHGRVEIEFRSVGEKRTYAVEQAPLRRMRYRAGDKVKTQENHEFMVVAVEERGGLLSYVGDTQKLSEADLSDRATLNAPQDRLAAGRFDSSRAFELRRRTLSLLYQARKSAARGFVGGRIDLIPHQLYIAHEVARRHAPRVMLSDEVGLGKTIEACLILHRLLLTGRASRVLVLVPESLTHQWFVELLRRFNLWFHIFDEERCASIEAGEPGANPFLDDQLVLCSIDFLAGSPPRAAQAVAAGWDILVVDEAHHLEWSENSASRPYQVVEELSRKSAGLLLLTATPEQLGVESHFARLRLLDPDRYRDLLSFQREARDYATVAEIAEQLSRRETLSLDQLRRLRSLLGQDTLLEERLAQVMEGREEPSQWLMDELLDLHGPGRVLFRNTRAAMRNFPKRNPRLVKLPPGPDAELLLDRLSTEFAQDAGDTTLPAALDLAKDPRVLWLVQLLSDLDPNKVLLIVRSIEKAEAVDAAVRRHLAVKTGIFHEGLTLLQRDRNAAWFAEAGGARLLICSEIGSEGRNFQFAQHLVLFDLPLNPELLEQRIGRLDRIGQKADIQIHVPFVEQSPQEVLVRWYHEGLNAFATNSEGGEEFLRRFGRAVHDLALEFPVAERLEAERELAELVARTASASAELRRVLEQGRDRLLELNSYRPAVAHQLIELIEKEDSRTELQEYLLDVFEHFGVHSEELAPRTWHLNSQGAITDSFPSIPVEGMVATCDRKRALSREDVGFLTWDHPMVGGAIDLLLGSETGTCSFAVLASSSEATILLEAVFVLETIAAPRLHAERFLAPTPVRVVVNQRSEDLTQSFPEGAWERKLQKGIPYNLIENDQFARHIIPAMLEKAEELARNGAAELRQAAEKRLNEQLGRELHRLRMLQVVNDHVRPEEIRLAEAEQAELNKVVRESRLRLDCLRLIWKGPPEAVR